MTFDIDLPTAGLCRECLQAALRVPPSHALHCGFVICFERRFLFRARNMQQRIQPNREPRPSGRSNPIMLKIEPYSHESEGDPPAAFATEAEVEIAARLRRHLEARYLAGSEAPPPLAAAVEDDAEGLL